MAYTLTDEDVALLREFGRGLTLADEPRTEHSIYITPANRLRAQADEMDRRDARIAAFRKLLERIESAK